MEVVRLRSVEWKPTAVVALATSVDQTQVAVAREDASIEIWNVAPGSVGWHCQLTIPGRNDYSISSLVWCYSSSSSSGRLFSSGLDGSIIEWDLYTLKKKASIVVIGGSVWQMVAEPLHERHALTIRDGVNKDDDENQPRSTPDESDSEDDDSDDDSDSLIQTAKDLTQRVAIACDDGAPRIYTVTDSMNGMEYYRSFPRVEGKALSVAWGMNGKTLFCGSSNGCIRCWDIVTSHELFRITAGHGGVGGGSDSCIWSLLVLRNGTLVSGDSGGSTQFWDASNGTLLHNLSCHEGDVLALAAQPSHDGVFSAGADGQIVHYKYMSESDGSKKLRKDVSGSTRSEWVSMGQNRVHTHDVKALTVAVPVVSETGKLLGSSGQKSLGGKNWGKIDYEKWALPGVPMLVSGGEDSKLFAYPADSFLNFYPFDICPAPQRAVVHLARNPRDAKCPIMMTQHSTWLDVSMINLLNTDIELGKRKSRDFGESTETRKKRHNHMVSEDGGKNFNVNKNFNGALKKGGRLTTGSLTTQLVSKKCKSSQHILCSALSESGQLIAFADRRKLRLYELKQSRSPEPQVGSSGWLVKKRRLPQGLSSALSIIFTSDSTKLIMASHCGKIHVIHIENVEILHTFDPSMDDTEMSMPTPPITKMCTSSDCQWLAAINCFGDIDVFNLEILRKHWKISRIDGAAVTASGFHPSHKNVLVITTSSNHVYGLDVEAKQLGEWSKRYASGLPQKFLEFPGGIIGLSFPPSPTATSVIVHGPRAMCLIDFGKPAKQDEVGLLKGKLPAIEARKQHLVNGNGKARNPKKRSTLTDKNFVIKPFENPVLFLTHLSDHSILLLEKPWVEVVRNFQAPVHRHVYGT